MQKYNSKKQRNQVVAEFAKGYISPKRVDEVKCCCSWIKFVENREGDASKWLEANSCNWRFCPLCSMRKSYRDALKIATVMAWIADEHTKDFIFLTLTVPNVKADKLRDTIDEMNKGWSRLFDRRAIADHACHGYLRKFEMTHDYQRIISQDMWDGVNSHNGKPRAGYFTRLGLKVGDKNPNFDTYHPHFHAIIVVNKSYFKSRDYISQAKWLEMWRESMRNPAITQVDIRRVNRRADSVEIAGSFDVKEFAKYSAKDFDFIVNAEVFDVFYHGLKGRRHHTFNGLFSTGNKKFKAGELESYIMKDKTEYMFEVLYRWGGTKYSEHRRTRLYPELDERLTLERGIIIAPPEESDEC